MGTGDRVWQTRRRRAASRPPPANPVVDKPTPPAEAERPPPHGREEVRLGELAAAFVLRGNFTYGGGSATIATLHTDIVDRRHWLADRPFQLAYALSRLSPGTNLLAFAACIGYQLRRMPGAVVALLAGSIPCAAM
ncbi:MAG TPA: chromate transporter, partial [Solirubrobacteraceae bacterium]|nr:chromate transporter [Solirubrobacteraceae bacterium]